MFGAIALAALPEGVRTRRGEERRGEGIRTIARDRAFLFFLVSSVLGAFVYDQANVTFQKARDMVKGLPEPSATLLTYVNDRNVKALGPILAPHLQLEADPAASPERAPMPPAAPVFLLHGAEDVVIPTAESVVLGDYLRSKGVEVHVLISQIITHAELDRSAAMSESWKLVSFWADVLRH